jgi:release factor glutamine methyltransferase
VSASVGIGRPVAVEPMATARQVAAILAAAGVASPQYDARVLIAHANSRDFTPAEFEELVAARAGRVPLQHLTGTTGFRYLDIAVGPGVFVPRPETELLVDAVLSAIADQPTPVVVDLCAGSGAIGLSVAHEHHAAVVHLVERSDAAYEWLERNAAGRDRVILHHADLAAALGGLNGTIDVVVSNPPYIPVDERDLVDPEVRDHDPAEALWGGEDGLDVVRRVVARAAVLLRPGGTLVIEHSERHVDSAPQLLADAGFIDVSDHPDLTGRARFVMGRSAC